MLEVHKFHEAINLFTTSLLFIVVSLSLRVPNLLALAHGAVLLFFHDEELDLPSQRGMLCWAENILDMDRTVVYPHLYPYFLNEYGYEYKY